jgi:hypothetical protein
MVPAILGEATDVFKKLTLAVCFILAAPDAAAAEKI